LKKKKESLDRRRKKRSRLYGRSCSAPGWKKREFCAATCEEMGTERWGRKGETGSYLGGGKKRHPSFPEKSARWSFCQEDSQKEPDFEKPRQSERKNNKKRKENMPLQEKGASKKKKKNTARVFWGGNSGNVEIFRKRKQHARGTCPPKRASSGKEKGNSWGRPTLYTTKTKEERRFPS